MNPPGTDHIRVVMDTDIGTDVDDILALAVLLGDPRIRLDGVTTVYGDVDLRARIVLKVLHLRDLPVGTIPVCAGISQPLLGIDPVYWPGHEGVGLLDPTDDLPAASPTHAVDLLIELVRANPGEITVLAVGPLTNIAAAITRDPGFATAIDQLVIMGGNIDARARAGRIDEHNIRSDPEAAHIVFASGAPISLIPLDVTLQTGIRRADVDRILESDTPYHHAIADQILRYPPFAERGDRTFLHDPLAALALIEPDLLGWHDLHVDVELRGTYTRAMTVALPPHADRPANARVAMHVNAPAAERAILQRLTR